MKILAIDPGSSLGWATNVDGPLAWGLDSFDLRKGETPGLRWVRFRNWFRGRVMNDPSSKGPRVDLVVFEQQLNFAPRFRRSADVLFGYTSRIEEFCALYGIECHPVNVSTLKSFALPAPKRPRRKPGDPPRPKLDRGKLAMIAAAKRQLLECETWNAADPQFAPLVEHEADALWLLWYAEQTFQGKERTA